MPSVIWSGHPAVNTDAESVVGSEHRITSGDSVVIGVGAIPIGIEHGEHTSATAYVCICAAETAVAEKHSERVAVLKENNNSTHRIRD